MNTPKIAALYACPIFNTLLRFPAFDTTTSLAEQVTELVAREARIVSEDGRRYRFDASHAFGRPTYRDDFGHRTSGFLDERCTKRQADWLYSQMPGWPEVGVAHLRHGMPEADTLLVNVVGYRAEEDGPETVGGMRYGSRQDLETILRGMASIRRKRRRQARKLEAQLRAYHQQQELANLKAGMWLGADKALTTAPRVDEPGVPFMGDTALTYAQRQALDLRHYAVYEHMGGGMSNSFPVGTGIALKPVKRSRELVDGAVYLWQWSVDGRPELTVLGRLDMSAKERGHLPLRSDDTGNVASFCWAAWGDENVKIYRVTHYTTRNGAPATEVAQQKTKPRRLSRARYGALSTEEARAYDQQRELAQAA